MRHHEGRVDRPRQRRAETALLNGMLDALEEIDRVLRRDGKDLPGGRHEQQGFFIRSQKLDRAEIHLAARTQHRARQAEERHRDGLGQGGARPHPFDLCQRDLLFAQAPGQLQAVPVEAVIGTRQGVQAVDQDGDGDEGQHGQKDVSRKGQADGLPVDQKSQARHQAGQKQDQDNMQAPPGPDGRGKITKNSWFRRDLVILKVGFGRLGGVQAKVHGIFHADLAAQEGAFLGGKSGGDDIAPDAPGGTDLDLLGGDIPLDRPRHDDIGGAHILAGHLAGLADHQHAFQADLPFEHAFDTHAPGAAQAALPDHPRAKYRGDAFHRLYGQGVGFLVISFEHGFSRRSECAPYFII